MIIQIGGQLISTETIVKVSYIKWFNEESREFDIELFGGVKHNIYVSGLQFYLHEFPNAKRAQGEPKKYWANPSKYQAMVIPKIESMHKQLLSYWSKGQEKIPIID